MALICFKKIMYLSRIAIIKEKNLTSTLPLCQIDLSTVSIKIPQIGKYPVYYNSNNQSFPPIFIGAILN